MPIIKPLLPFILLLILTLCAVTLYLSYERNKKDPFGKIINTFTIYLFIHAGYVWVIECFFLTHTWLDLIFPSIFLHGPFYYFAHKVSVEKDLSKTRILIHSIPFCFFLLASIIYVFGGWYYNNLEYDFFKNFTRKASLISLSAYCIYAFSKGNMDLMDKLNSKRTIVMLARPLLLFLTLFFFAVSASGSIASGNEQTIYLIRLTFYCFILIITLMIFVYQTIPFFNEIPTTALRQQSEYQNNRLTKPKYEKSRLTELQLDTYEKKMNEVIIHKQLFLNTELSLTDLALETKIPVHHLTQLLNTRLNINFHNYINHLRVIHTCELMEASFDRRMSIEELGSLSGFNSKVTFNRHFKFWMKCTPSEYRSRL